MVPALMITSLFNRLLIVMKTSKIVFSPTNQLWVSLSLTVNVGILENSWSDLLKDFANLSIVILKRLTDLIIDFHKRRLTMDDSNNGLKKIEPRLKNIINLMCWHSILWRSNLENPCFHCLQTKIMFILQMPMYSITTPSVDNHINYVKISGKLKD